MVYSKLETTKYMRGKPKMPKCKNVNMTAFIRNYIYIIKTTKYLVVFEKYWLSVFW